VVVIGWPYAEFEANKKDPEGSYLKSLELAPESPSGCATQSASAVPRRRDSKLFRKPYGPGWRSSAMPATSGSADRMGISDAFRDATLCAKALAESFAGTRPFDDAMRITRRSATNTHCRCSV